MASIPYTASCCASLRIYKYLNREGITAKAVREKGVINALAYGTKNGVTVFATCVAFVQNYEIKKRMLLCTPFARSIESVEYSKRMNILI